MYKIYISAASTPDQIGRVATWTRRLKESNVEVVSTWPEVVAAAGGIGNPRDATPRQRRQRSWIDLAEVSSADALWFMVPPAGVYTRGAWGELTWAHSDRIRIVSSGDTKQSIFTALGEEYETDEEAFDALVRR